jgi:hypothetical protein
MSAKEFGFVLLFLAAWIVLNRWVLPWFGVPTCMSGGCSGGSCSWEQRPAVSAPASPAVDDESSPAESDQDDARRSGP